MDFDEYDYLEKTVEGVHIPKESNGGGGRDRRYAPKRTIPDDGYGFDDRSKTNRSGQVLDRREWPTKAHGFRDRRYREGLNDREKQRGEVGDKGRVRIDRYKEHGVNDRDRSDRDTRDIDTREKVKGRDDRTHDKDKERDRDLEVDMGRSHSRSRGLDRPLDQRKRVRGRDREWGRQMELMDPDKDQEGEHGPSGERREKEEPVPAEPEADPERDQRTVFAYQVSLKADEKDVYEFFSMAGKVRDVRLIMDRNSKRSKGVGYIEFYDAMSVPVAIAMSGQLLRGQPIMVKPSEAEKNLVQSTSAVGGNTGGFIGPYSGGARRLYVGNLHFNITEDQLRQVFEPFGPVELVQVPTDPEAGQCKGFGFVQYARLEDARAAQQALNGVLELAGRVIKVSAVSDQIGMPDIGGTSGELDDDEGGGLSLTARSRALLMQKLDRSGTVTSIAAPVTRPALGLLAGAVSTATISPLVSGSVLGQVGLSGIASVNAGLGAATLGSSALEPVGAPTDCLMLKNMFDPKTEMEPDFDLDIKDEVQHECSKFGVVKHIFVDKNSLGHVFLRFDTLTAAVNAQRALHGRWFAGKMITTQFLTPRAYEAKFPECQ